MARNKRRCGGALVTARTANLPGTPGGEVRTPQPAVQELVPIRCDKCGSTEIDDNGHHGKVIYCRCRKRTCGHTFKVYVRSD